MEIYSEDEFNEILFTHNRMGTQGERDLISEFSRYMDRKEDVLCIGCDRKINPLTDLMVYSATHWFAFRAEIERRLRIKFEDGVGYCECGYPIADELGLTKLHTKLIFIRRDSTKLNQ